MPYEGEREGDSSASEGTLPVQLDGELLTIEGDATDERVLDACTGTGDLAVALRESGAGEVVGVLTDTDLLRHHLKSPFHLLKSIERTSSFESLVDYGDKLAGLVEGMVASGLDAAQIDHFVDFSAESLEEAAEGGEG